MYARNFYSRDFWRTFFSCPTLIHSFTTRFSAKARDGLGKSMPSWHTFWQYLGILAYKRGGLTGFSTLTWTGFYGVGWQVQRIKVTGTITSIGQTIALACNDNPTKVTGSKIFLLAIQIMIDGYTKANPPTKKSFQSKRMYPSCLLRWVTKS